MADWISLEDAGRALKQGDGTGVTVAIIDSGVEVSHQLLAGLSLRHDLAVVREGYRLTVVPGNGQDVYGHGTAIAGIIRKLAPRAIIGSIRALGSDLSCRAEVIHRAALESIDLGYKILNCSFGSAVKQQVLGFKAWVDEAYLKGVHVVAACNNEDFTITEWPAYFSSVISVNMTRAETDDDGLFYFQRGSLVEFLAGGVNVRVAWRDGEERVQTGSSYASPRLVGLLARLLSQYPELSPTQAKALLHKMAKVKKR